MSRLSPSFRAALRAAVRTCRDGCAAARRAVPTVLGAPDYDRYVAFVHARDPGRAVPDRETFERERLDARYARPGARCC